MKTTPPPTPFRQKSKAAESSHELQEQIRQRAYELYEQRRREDGHELDDWLQAEAEVKEKRQQPLRKLG